MSIETTLGPPLRPATQVRRAIRRLELSATAWIGVTMALLCIAVGVFGPFFAPHSPVALLGPPLGAPRHGYPLGFDYLGRDALSRFLWGGRTAIFLAALGFAFGALGGLAIGLFCAYNRGRSTYRQLDDRGRRRVPVVDPHAAADRGPWRQGLGHRVGSRGRPSTPRYADRACGWLDVSSMAYVEVAEARGERRSYIMFREMLPGVMPVFLVDAGIRIPASILLVASLSFLGLGVQPPTADWGLIISENREGFTTQPWAVIAPIAALAVLMIGVNLAVDGFQRERSLEVRRTLGR